MGRMKRRSKRSSQPSSFERSPPQRPGTSLRDEEARVETSVSFMKFFFTFFFVYHAFGIVQRKLFKSEASCVVSALKELSDERRRHYFHPVIVFPNADFDNYGGDYAVLDFSEGIPDIIDVATSLDEVPEKKCGFFHKLRRKCNKKASEIDTSTSVDFPFTVGKYDEHRRNVYETELFNDISNEVEGFSGKRDLHVGIDLGGPAGSEVYAVSDGIIHSVGYNSAPGDYGYVVIIEHDLPSAILTSSSCGKENKLYALYGHLSKKMIRYAKVGQVITKGDHIAFIGNPSENGGWPPHVHFQLSLEAPSTHDMPGVVAMKDRRHSLLKYPDPRLLLGPLY